MKVALVCVGRVRGPLAEVIADFESRIQHYFNFESLEVKEATGRSTRPADAIEEEGRRLLARVPDAHEVVVLHRPGKRWSSVELANLMADAGLHGTSGLSFVIGGAYGLSTEIRQRARYQMSLSALTFPHEIARLMLVEQIYRAGTIIRGEPYHKGPVR